LLNHRLYTFSTTPSYGQGCKRVRREDEGFAGRSAYISMA
jgi:hypothetical protein